MGDTSKPATPYTGDRKLEKKLPQPHMVSRAARSQDVADVLESNFEDILLSVYRRLNTHA